MNYARATSQEPHDPETPRGETLGASRAAIEHHYDVGRDFYGLWLDSEMVYSCAMWADGSPPDGDLETAQKTKMAWHAESAHAQGAARVLDVGCGWGALARHLVAEHGVEHVTGLTLSADQAAYVASGSGSAGPGPRQGRIEVRLEDWRDHRPAAPYDAIVSVGAFEHFARHGLERAERRAVYRSFFDAAGGWIRPGGWMSLQTIAYDDADPDKVRNFDFLTEEIFPESGLPTLADVVVAAEPSWRIVKLRSDPDHYAATLRIWQDRLEANRGPATDLVGRSTYRRYARYLRLCRALFDQRACTLYRISLQRRNAATLSEQQPTPERAASGGDRRP